MKKFFSREPVRYVFWGVTAAIINYAVFWIFYDLVFQQSRSLFSNCIAFTVAVIFAFVTNKLFVFRSKSWAASVIGREIPEFLLARLITFLVEELGLFLSEHVFDLGKYTLLTLGSFTLDGIVAAKFLLAIVTISLNYLFNILIFKQKK